MFLTPCPQTDISSTYQSAKHKYLQSWRVNDKLNFVIDCSKLFNTKQHTHAGSKHTFAVKYLNLSTDKRKRPLIVKNTFTLIMQKAPLKWWTAISYAGCLISSEVIVLKQVSVYLSLSAWYCGRPQGRLDCNHRRS